MDPRWLLGFKDEMKKIAAAPALQGFKQPGLRGMLPAWAMPKPAQKTVGQLTQNALSSKPIITTKPGRPAPLIQMPGGPS